MKNDGKKFEDNFRKSIIQRGYWYYRLKDSAQSFNTKSTLRFSLKNPYDCLIYTGKNLFTLELKSTKGTSFSFPPINELKSNNTYMIHKHQIDGLINSSKYENIIAGFVLDFRESSNNTYFWSVSDFLKFTNSSNKKSFNEKDVVINNGILINKILKRTTYDYNIDKLIVDCVKLYEKEKESY